MKEKYDADVPQDDGGQAKKHKQWSDHFVLLILLMFGGCFVEKELKNILYQIQVEFAFSKAGKSIFGNSLGNRAYIGLVFLATWMALKPWFWEGDVYSYLLEV